jgi:copper transport protein
VPRLRLLLLAGVTVLAACGGDAPSRPTRAASDHVGPGPVARTVTHGGYRVALQLTPNRPAVPNRFAVRLTKDGRPVTGAKVTASFAMVEMDMGTSAYRLRERSPGLYAGRTAGMFMAGDWRLGVRVRPPAGAAFAVHVVDRAGV